MKYLRKKSNRLRRLAARRLKTLRKQLRKIDLSLSVELNLLIIKLEFTIKRREEQRCCMAKPLPGLLPFPSA